ncbi:MAG: type II CRISPR-associated endonuclease Cas1 [Candidatus Nitrohelix vancouverensis]|uniref:CRISPR-associated endonuclease Cas1 n=1 Tax=Candidatus Nitrohelix vancouverensis TaxID=2705534 RepID=A0A7T0C2L6_9BACT|nr:MAG: type II CRISPR-associated endonuclease Cas1 [Candidatus Nitrohelix vancouverensis]
MNQRIVEISEAGQYIHVHRGFLIVSREKVERGRVPLADIAVLILSGPGSTISTNAVNTLVDENCSVIFCGANYHPKGMVLPVAPHHQHPKRLHQQINATLPLKKRLWQTLVRAKIENQAAVLEAIGRKDEVLYSFARRVQSGDPDNLEAQSARRYWPQLFNEDFRRDPEGDPPNNLLNYGYAIIRASAARAISISGFHPALGLHHRNQSNAFCLADDLMEPFRPIVDCAVKHWFTQGVEKVSPEIKKQLAGLLDFELAYSDGIRTLSNGFIKLAQSLARSFETKSADLDLPQTPLPIEWASLE